MITGRFPLSPIFRKNPRLIIMALTQQQQFLEAIKRSTSPLLCIPKAGGIDSYATALGLASVLQKLQKSPEIIAVDGPAPKQLHFLKNYENIKQTLHQIRNLLIEVDIQKTALFPALINCIFYLRGLISFRDLFFIHNRASVAKK